MTVALLLIGVWQVTLTVSAMRDLGTTVAQVFAQQKLGTFTSNDLAQAVGIAAIAVQLLALALAIGFAVPRIRAGKPAWWIPVVAAAVATTVTLILVITVIVSDPAFTVYLNAHQS